MNGARCVPFLPTPRRCRVGVNKPGAQGVPELSRGGPLCAAVADLAEGKLPIVLFLEPLQRSPARESRG